MVELSIINVHLTELCVSLMKTNDFVRTFIILPLFLGWLPRDFEERFKKKHFNMNIIAFLQSDNLTYERHTKARLKFIAIRCHDKRLHGDSDLHVYGQSQYWPLKFAVWRASHRDLNCLNHNFKLRVKYLRRRFPTSRSTCLAVIYFSLSPIPNDVLMNFIC